MLLQRAADIAVLGLRRQVALQCGIAQVQFGAGQLQVLADGIGLVPGLFDRLGLGSGKALGIHCSDSMVNMGQK